MAISTAIAFCTETKQFFTDEVQRRCPLMIKNFPINVPFAGKKNRENFRRQQSSQKLNLKKKLRKINIFHLIP